MYLYCTAINKYNEFQLFSHFLFKTTMCQNVLNYFKRFIKLILKQNFI